MPTHYLYIETAFILGRRKGRAGSGCLQHVKHWRMRDLTGFIGILLPACMLRVIDTKQTVRYLLPQAATPCPPPKRGLLALRFTQLSAKSPHWRRYLNDFVNLTPVLLTASLRASCPEGVFPCKYTADGRNDKCRHGFRREGLAAAFRKFQRALEIWAFRPRPLASRLSYPPFCPQWNSARKTAFPATKPERTSQKGKELKPTTFKNIGLCV